MRRTSAAARSSSTSSSSVRASPTRSPSTSPSRSERARRDVGRGVEGEDEHQEMPCSSAVSADARAMRRVSPPACSSVTVDARRRKHCGAGLRPLDEHDRVLEVRLEVSPLRTGNAREAVEVEVRHVDVAGVAVADREGRARDRRRHAQRATGAAHERRLARTELTRDADDVADDEAPGQGGRDSLGLARGDARELAAHVRRGRAEPTPARTASSAAGISSVTAGSSTVRSSSAGMRAKSSSSTFSIDGVYSAAAGW